MRYFWTPELRLPLGVTFQVFYPSLIALPLITFFMGGI